MKRNGLSSIWLTLLLAAYWRFFDTFNTRDAYAFSSAMSYPHVRVSWAQEPTVLADQEAHALSVGWDRFIRAGWDHTEGMEPEILGESNEKAHIAGGWTRVTKTGETLLTNRVCYIASCVEGQWGIQSRFGTDSRDGESDSSRSEQGKALGVIRHFLQNASNDAASVEHVIADEVFVIEAGGIRRVRDGNDFEIPCMASPSLRVIYAGPTSVSVNATEGDEAALIYAVRLDSTWKIRAGSWL